MGQNNLLRSREIRAGGGQQVNRCDVVTHSAAANCAGYESWSTNTAPAGSGFLFFIVRLFCMRTQYAP